MELTMGTLLEDAKLIFEKMRDGKVNAPQANMLAEAWLDRLGWFIEEERIAFLEWLGPNAPESSLSAAGTGERSNV